MAAFLECRSWPFGLSTVMTEETWIIGTLKKSVVTKDRTIT